jgi:hypothetical protein
MHKLFDWSVKSYSRPLHLCPYVLLAFYYYTWKMLIHCSALINMLLGQDLKKCIVLENFSFFINLIDRYIGQKILNP